MPWTDTDYTFYCIVVKVMKKKNYQFKLALVPFSPSTFKITILLA